MSPLLSARRIGKKLRDGDAMHTILHAIDLELTAGEWVALLGPSGSGKSTLLQIVGALDPAYDGEVRMGNVVLGTLADAALARFRNQTFGFVFQAYNLLGHLSALENVMLPARFGPAAADPRRANELLERVGLGSKGHRLPPALSGGERQRVAIARALYNRPKVLFCDEPTGNLDADTGAGILQLFAQLCQDGVALLCATHDPAIGARAQRALRLHNGELQA